MHINIPVQPLSIPDTLGGAKVVQGNTAGLCVSMDNIEKVEFPKYT